ncbi:MAG: class I SAM-dependent methyltransferase, partial [Pseudomonadota bacterium]
MDIIKGFSVAANSCGAILSYFLSSLAETRETTLTKLYPSGQSMRRKSCPDEFQCLLCDSNTCFITKTGLQGVTSDLRPWPRSGVFAVCSDCGHVQKLLNQDWIDDVERIYSSYEMYTVSGGQEQRLFDCGLPLPRSMKLLENLVRAVELPDEGRLLDFGCGNGAFLKSFSQFLSGWRLSGFDINARFADALSEIEGFEGLYTDSLEQIAECFDLVTMAYVIEHLDEPKKILERLNKLIKPEGVLFVQTSSFEENPFDLMVVDHCSHFSLPTISFLASRAGFSVVSDTRGWVSKELGVICVPNSNGNFLSPSPDFITNQQLQ